MARDARGADACRLRLSLGNPLVPAHQRDFQYTPGGSRVAPETVGLDGFATVEISTEDGERIVAWWAAPPSGGGVVLFLHGTPSTLPDTVWRLPDLRKSGLGVMAIDYRG